MSVAFQKWRKRHARLMMLRLLTKKLLSLILVLPSPRTDHNVFEFDEDLEEPTMVPRDVKEGHFAVISVKGGEKKRFILDLRNLRNPEFLELLEQAKEEYGFQKEGVLVFPCQPEELQKILKGSTTS
ncbi:putative SAUR-like auxin-responsive protein family [Hibiscus syriacus]|uniref:SAUR-like auxin-responsive protein family n=1 Tax=Hibiscus syriacus TaxID=106335 RepID=A0A6A2XW45_HIBSY|nr:auxin-responsive protein SAUR50-like [Hibiscus syriacus]KAE8666256.1 putative SAUR-like auxin-responsive protein family [Hibiscus syriacus]